MYRDLVKQARTPLFYRDLGVPDTPEGRFEMVGLHAALVLRRLRSEGAPGSALAQELFDLLFADVDEGLRHIGVGRTNAGTYVLLLVQDLDVRVIDAATGELLRELTIDPFG